MQRNHFGGPEEQRENGSANGNDCARPAVPAAWRLGNHNDCGGGQKAKRRNLRAGALGVPASGDCPVFKQIVQAPASVEGVIQNQPNLQGTRAAASRRGASPLALNVAMRHAAKANTWAVHPPIRAGVSDSASDVMAVVPPFRRVLAVHEVLTIAASPAISSFFLVAGPGRGRRSLCRRGRGPGYVHSRVRGHAGKLLLLHHQRTDHHHFDRAALGKHNIVAPGEKRGDDARGCAGPAPMPTDSPGLPAASDARPPIPAPVAVVSAILCASRPLLADCTTVPSPLFTLAPLEPGTLSNEPKRARISTPF